MTHVFGNDQWLTAYEHATKLFEVGSLPIAVMTYGVGNLGHLSIEGVMRKFNKRLGKQNTVRSITQSLLTFVKPLYDAQFAQIDPDHQPVLGLIVGGYAPTAELAEVREFQLPRDKTPQVVLAQAQFGANWRGVDGPFTRLCKGFDGALIEAVVQAGVPAAAIPSIVDPLEMPTIYDGMPMQDAVDFTTFVLNTTIGYARFANGVPACGGPLQLVAMTADHQLAWVAKPSIRAK